MGAEGEGQQEGSVGANEVQVPKLGTLCLVDVREDRHGGWDPDQPQQQLPNLPAGCAAALQAGPTAQARQGRTPRAPVQPLASCHLPKAVPTASLCSGSLRSAGCHLLLQPVPLPQETEVKGPSQESRGSLVAPSLALPWSGQGYPF